MFTDLDLPSFSSRSRLDHLRIGLISALAMVLSSTTAPAQTDGHRTDDTSSDNLSKLYDCASLYVVINRCYALEETETSRRASITAAENRDKMIHLIFIAGQRAGMLTETLQSNMQSSIQKMMLSMDNECRNVVKPMSDLRSSCDKIAESVPKMSYDRGRKLGDSGRYVSVSAE